MFRSTKASLNKAFSSGFFTSRYRFNTSHKTNLIIPDNADSNIQQPLI